jgi:ABC-type multidrug transport system fused ATPase/permease subunit
MDRGQIAEMDHPVNLWDREDGIFRAMCERSGITREDILADE